jgi:capsular polysaccharide biosynthesis protein
VEIDEVAARLLRQYWALLVICVAVPLVAISYITAKQPAMYSAGARIITGSVVPQSSAAADAVASQVQAIATGRTAAAQALRASGADRNLNNFISNNISVSGLGSSQVIDLTVTDRSPQVAQKVARVLAAEVVGSLNNVGQSGLRAALTANDQEIVRLSQRRAIMAKQFETQPHNQQLQSQLAGLDQVIANFTGDRSRLLIQAGTLGLATVIDPPALPSRPQSKATVQKLGLAGLLGLVAGILIATVAETLRPTVPGAPRVSRRLGVPTLGRLSNEDLNGEGTPALGEMALRLRLVAAHSDLRTIALVDVDGRRELAALAAGLAQFLQVSSPEGAAARFVLDGAAGHQRWNSDGEPTLVGVSPSVLVKPRDPVTENQVLRVYPLGQMKWVAGMTQVGIVVLSGPVARVSRITALQDLSASSGWPIVGVIGVPRIRRGWWARRARPAASKTEPVNGQGPGSGAAQTHEGRGR